MTAQPVQLDFDTPAYAVVPQVGTRLRGLHELYAEKKAAADQAAKELKAVVDGIKNELTAAAPDQPKVDLLGEGLPPIGLRLVTSQRFDTRAFKRADPATYAAYCKPSQTWSLKPLSADTEDGA